MSARLPLIAQLGVGLLAVPALALAPPARGMIMLVPLAGNDDGAAARLALGKGARLIGAGTLPGSLVVYGEARALAGPALAAGMVAVRGPAGGCATRRS